MRGGDEAAVRRRQRLADRLIECGTLERKRARDVRELLGRPYDEDRTRLHKRGLFWYYLVGPERSYTQIDNEWLLVEFDANRRVKRVSLVTD